VLIYFLKEIGFVWKHKGFFECLCNLLNSISLLLYFLVDKLLKLIGLKFSVAIKFNHSLVEIFQCLHHPLQICFELFYFWCFLLVFSSYYINIWIQFIELNSA
jgi:hypothetical protein